MHYEAISTGDWRIMKRKYIILLLVSRLNHLPKSSFTNFGVIYLSCTITRTFKKNHTSQVFFKSNIDVKIKYINI